MILNKSRGTVMLVDDNIANLRLNKSVLSDQYDVLTALSAQKMFELLEKFKAPDLILLDVNMPVMDGYAAIKILKSNVNTKQIPVIFLTGKADTDSEMTGFSLGAVDYIIKPFVPELLRKRVELYIKSIRQTAELEEKVSLIEDQRRQLAMLNDNLSVMVDQKVGKIKELQVAVIKILSTITERRDDITGGHVDRAAKLVEMLIKQMRLMNAFDQEEELLGSEMVIYASQLHDVGKISIPDSILLKPGRLTPEEFEEIKTHTTKGAEILRDVMNEVGDEKNEFFDLAISFALYHHEKWDGTGYPHGLKGKDIPITGRVMAVCDVYDALTHVRPYKEAFSHEQALRIIEDGKKRAFDPVITDAFLRCADAIKVMDWKK